MTPDPAEPVVDADAEHVEPEPQADPPAKVKAKGKPECKCRTCIRKPASQFHGMARKGMN